MTVAEFFVFVAAGRTLTWLAQNNGLTRSLWRLHPRLTELGECDLCLGFWVFLALAYLLKAAPFGLWAWWLEPVILAALSTLIAHIMKIGWQSKFGVTVIG